MEGPAVTDGGTITHYSPQIDSAPESFESRNFEQELATPTSPPRPGRRKSVIAVVIMSVLATAVGGFFYLRHVRQYVSTENAQVDGDQIQINAPTTGSVMSWTITQGSQVHANQVIGKIQVLGTGPQKVIKAPGNGTVAETKVVSGAYVSSGANLATAYDFNKVYITARVDETDVADVHIGAPVELDVDAFSGVPITGVVEDVQSSSAGSFSLFPQDNSSGNFQKVTQVIPVKIELTNTDGKQLTPGMNVTAHIHKTFGQ